jgi:hypothetical protein
MQQLFADSPQRVLHRGKKTIYYYDDGLRRIMQELLT